MLVGYEANTALRHSGKLGDYGRTLISQLASRHVADYRALLFASRIKKSLRQFHTGYANVSTYLPSGSAKLFPELWMRYQIEPWLKAEKVALFHALNEEIPYNINPTIKTILTCHGLGSHHATSAADLLFWRRRIRYSLRVANAVVVESEEARQGLAAEGVNPDKIVVIGGPNPLELTPQMVEQYYMLYCKLDTLGSSDPSIEP
ncbi:MAG: glycosyltransferase [Bacteroidales bacterium]|nr:glycosyltransferase [Bacteroidales bacterium]